MTSNRILAAVLAGALFAGSGCSSKRTSGWEAGDQGRTPPTASAQPEVKADSMAKIKELWAYRESRSNVEEALKLLEAAHAADPKDTQVMTMLSMVYYWMGDAFTEDVSKKIELHDKGAFYGEKALATVPGFTKAMTEEGKPEPERLKAAMALVPKELIGALYWTSSNLGRWGLAKGVVASMFKVPTMKALNERIIALDDKYMAGGAYRFFGGLYAKLPPFSGGSMTKAKEFFDKAFAVSDKAFVTHTLYAELYAVKMDDRDLFKKHLEQVIKGDPNGWPDMTAEQKQEQKKAKELLAKMDELF